MQFLLLIIFFSLNSYATKSVQLPPEGPQVEISGPQGYRLERDFLGLPWVFIEEGKTSNRSSLVVTLSGLANVDFNPLLLQKNYQQYQEGREAWAKKNGLSIKKFLPYQTFKNPQDKEIHAAGYIFANEQGVFHEQSFYLECPKNLVHLKILIETTKVDKMNHLLQSIKTTRCL
jgi:hypothetical protein